MPARRSVSPSPSPAASLPARALPLIFVLLAAFGAQHAQAALFDDEEARRQIRDLSIQTKERIDTLTKAQFELTNQIQALREENAKLRGQNETLSYELEAAKKRQQDFYIDLDDRLRKIESMPPPEAKPAEEPRAALEPPKKPASDPALEARDYETALNFFKANKLKEAASAFEAFTHSYPDSTLAPNAQYWLGNAHYALRDCKKAIEAHRVVVNTWPQNAKAPDSLINIATCQQELGDAKLARTTLETVLAKYPDSSAAATAKSRLRK